MNFLAHYYIDRKKEEPAFTLGLLMPDMLRNFLKIGTRIKDDLQHPKGADSIRMGSKKHHESDVFFHNCEPFVQLNDQVTQKLRTSSLSFKRDWFLSHIFVELMLDRVILQNNPLLSVELYDELSQVNRWDIELYLKTGGIHEIDLFFEGYNRFLSARYLDTYTDPDSIAYAMSRIASRMRIDISAAGQKTFLSNLAVEMEPQILNFMDFLDEAFKKIHDRTFDDV